MHVGRNLPLYAAGIAAIVGYLWVTAPPVRGASAQQNSPTPATIMAGTQTPVAAGITCGQGQASLSSASLYVQTSLPNNSNAIFKCVTTDGVNYAWQTPYNAAVSIVGATASFGGSALLLGGSVSSTATVTGAPVGSNCIATRADGTLLSVGLVIDCAVTATNTATVRVSALIAGTPAAGIYNIRVIL